MSAPPVEYGQTLIQLEKSLDKQQAKTKKSNANANSNNSSRVNSVGPSPLIPAHVGSEIEQFTLRYFLSLYNISILVQVLQIRLSLLI